jgi:bifunctional non-homologous end joining protein LigD
LTPKWEVGRGRRAVRLSSPDRVLFPDDGVTKGDLFEYYREVAPAIVPHLRDRPFTMKRWREGIAGPAFFQKQAPKGIPSWLKTRQFRTWPREGGSRLVDFPLVDDELALLWMVQFHCIDMNAWYSRVDKPDRPDFVLFDLDPPDARDGFAQAVRVAHLVREALEELELRSYVKTSGADGIHVLSPRHLRDDLRVRGTAFAAARSRASGTRDDGVAEEEAERRTRRSPPERTRQDDCLGLLRAAEAGRARLDAAALGGADGAGEAS